MVVPEEKPMSHTNEVPVSEEVGGEPMTGFAVNEAEIRAIVQEIQAGFSSESSDVELTFTLNDGRWYRLRKGGHDNAVVGSKRWWGLKERLKNALPGEDYMARLYVPKDGTWSFYAVPFGERSLSRGPMPPAPERATIEFTEADRAEMKKLWADSVGTFETNEPATESEIQALEARIGVQLSEPHKELLRLTNGAEVEFKKGEDYNEYLTQGWRILATDDIPTIYTHYNLNDEFPDPEIRNNHAGVLQDHAAHAQWIPFADDLSGNFLAIDAAPGPFGTPGQILEYGNDLPEGGVLWAASLLDFMRGNKTHKATTAQSIQRPQLPHTPAISPICQQIPEAFG